MANIPLEVHKIVKEHGPITAESVTAKIAEIAPGADAANIAKNNLELGVHHKHLAVNAADEYTMTELGKQELRKLHATSAEIAKGRDR